MLRLVLAALLLAPAACQKSAAPSSSFAPAAQAVAGPALVAPAARSRHFEAVSRQLELGGTMFGYMDVDGDMGKLVAYLKQVTATIPTEGAPPQLAEFLQKDFSRMFGTLGLSDVAAFGVSSAPAADGMFSNRLYLHTPGGRHGFLAALGGAPAPFAHARLAPADADIYTETELDLTAIYAAIKDVVAQAAGADAAAQMEAALQQGAEEAGATPLDVIKSVKGRVVMLARLDPKETVALPLPQPVKVPAFSVLLRVDGLGAALAPALAKAPKDAFIESTDGAMKVFALKIPLPVEGLRPALAIEGGALWVATTPEFLKECRDRKAGLDQSADFRQSLAAVGGEQGNSLSYISPQLFERVRGALAEAGRSASPEVQKMLALYARELPAPKRPIVSVSVNLPDGILIRALNDHSFKQELLAVPAAVGTGLLAAMAVPAFQKVRASSQDKAVMSNLRQLGMGAEMYYLETGKDTATYDQIVGPQKEKMVKSITPVAGEDYTKLRFKMGEPIKITLPDGRVIQLDP